MNKTVVIILGVFVYLLTSAASYSYFNKNAVDTSSYEAPVLSEDGSVIEGGPLTE